MKNFPIGKTLLNKNSPTFIIAEVGLSHDGSLGSAHAFIDALSKTGVDAIKFQTHIAAAESSAAESFRVNVFPQDKSRYDYWERTAFSLDQWAGLKRHADDKGILFLSTPFSLEAINLLNKIGIEAWKIGSGEVNNFIILEKLSQLKKSVILSSGLSYLYELDKAIDFLQRNSTPVMLMQCTSKYPCQPEYFGLNLISEFQKRFNIPIGFSDHSGQLSTNLAAVTLGAKCIESHVIWHKECFGPDVKASITIDELSLLVKEVRLIERALNNPINKDTVTKDLEDMRTLFTKGLVAKKNINQNTKIESHHLEAVKPCLGIPAYEYHSVLGIEINKNLKKGDIIRYEDLKSQS